MLSLNKFQKTDMSGGQKWIKREPHMFALAQGRRIVMNMISKLPFDNGLFKITISVLMSTNNTSMNLKFLPQALTS